MGEEGVGGLVTAVVGEELTQVEGERVGGLGEGRGGVGEGGGVVGGEGGGEVGGEVEGEVEGVGGVLGMSSD